MNGQRSFRNRPKGKNVMKRILWISSITLLAVTLSQSVLADENKGTSGPWERFSVNAGWFVTALNSDVRIGSEELGAGIDIDLEDALGMDTTTSVFRADALYRFGQSRRHRFDFSFFEFRRDATKTLGREIEIRDRTYSVGTTVDSHFNLSIYKGAYSYSFFQDDRLDMGASFGVFVMPIEFGISAAGGAAQEESITAPLPVVGLRFDYAITPKLFLRQGVEFFYLEYQDFKGHMMNSSIRLEYNAWKHVGLGIGYDAFRLRIEARGEDYPEIDLNGSIEFEYAGILLYGKVYF